MNLKKRKNKLSNRGFLLSSIILAAGILLLTMGMVFCNLNMGDDRYSPYGTYHGIATSWDGFNESTDHYIMEVRDGGDDTASVLVMEIYEDSMEGTVITYLETYTVLKADLANRECIVNPTTQGSYENTIIWKLTDYGAAYLVRQMYDNESVDIGVLYYQKDEVISRGTMESVRWILMAIAGALSIAIGVIAILAVAKHSPYSLLHVIWCSVCGLLEIGVLQYSYALDQSLCDLRETQVYDLYSYIQSTDQTVPDDIAKVLERIRATQMPVGVWICGGAIGVALLIVSLCCGMMNIRNKKKQMIENRLLRSFHIGPMVYCTQGYETMAQFAAASRKGLLLDLDYDHLTYDDETELGVTYIPLQKALMDRIRMDQTLRGLRIHTGYSMLVNGVGTGYSILLSDDSAYIVYWICEEYITVHSLIENTIHTTIEEVAEYANA